MLRAKLDEFSTASVPASQRVRRWMEFGSDTLSEMVVSPIAHDFQATLRRFEIGPMGLIFMDTSPASALGSAGQIGGWAAPDRDALVLTVVDRGGCTLSQDRWSVDLAEGDMVIRDLTKSWHNLSPHPSRLVLVKIPYSNVLRRVPDPERIVGHRLAANLAPVAFATSVIRASHHALISDPAGEWYDLLGDVLTDIFRLVCDGTELRDNTDEVGVTSTVRRSAMSYILQHLDDPELTVSQVADHLGISLRHLQRVFLAGGKTPRQFILDQRLDQAAKLIGLSVDTGGACITDIAFSLGFNDLSHFSRTFSRRYGCAPRLYRRAKHH